MAADALRLSRISSRAAGFTLIELLVGLALMGMAAALLLQGLQMAGTIAVRERRGVADADDVVAAQRVVRRRIERLRSVTRLDSAIPIVDAHGSSEDFTFVAPAPDQAGPDALQRFQLTRSATGVLTLYSVSTRASGVDRNGHDLAGWTAASLLNGVAALSLAYYEGGSAPGWRSAWQNRTEPPALVRIRVAFAPGDRRFWPDLVVRPRATLNGACRIDPTTGLCGTGA